MCSDAFLKYWCSQGTLEQPGARLQQVRVALGQLEVDTSLTI